VVIKISERELASESGAIISYQQWHDINKLANSSPYTAVTRALAVEWQLIKKIILRWTSPACIAILFLGDVVPEILFESFCTCQSRLDVRQEALHQLLPVCTRHIAYHHVTDTWQTRHTHTILGCKIFIIVTTCVSLGARAMRSTFDHIHWYCMYIARLTTDIKSTC